MNPVHLLAGEPEEVQRAVLKRLTKPQRRELRERWLAWAHPGQAAPPAFAGAGQGDWRAWLLMAGRGFGKTRAGAEWVSALARADPSLRIALVGGTNDEVRKVMIEGESGLFAVARPDERFGYAAVAGTLRFPSGALAQVYSSRNPEKLRGPQHHIAWCDELAKWARPDETWDNLMLGLRLGERQHAVVTTTPRAIPLLGRIIADPDTVTTRGGTADNPHLSEAYLAAMQRLYGGTRRGRQELEGELIDDVEGALWTRALIEAARTETAEADAMERIVIGVDPPAGVGERADACGIVAAGRSRDADGEPVAYVLGDRTIKGASPERWAAAVAAAAEEFGADRVVAEANNGGAMVASVLRGARRSLPIRLVHASRGKAARAEPVAALFESGQAWFAGSFPALEDELCGIVAGGGYEGPGRSPDRADAMVWAMTDLMLAASRAPRVLAL
ncbi:DNA-packaging protein [Sphingosinicella sp.]|uniref:DNA-packaging protein n=1 Tax=Sphingosinicella sp. TaxID=1917971 RepID=UPI004037C468